MNRPAMRLLDLLYPNRCGCCRCRIAFDRLLCEDCENELRSMRADYSAWARRHIGTVFPWDGAAAGFMYQGAAKAGVLALKDGLRNFGDYAGRQLAGQIQEDRRFSGMTCVTWVPVTEQRRRIQGYAHAERIGKAAAKALGIPARGGLLTEHAGKLRQHQVSYAERAQYAARFRDTGRDLSGERILLCDDVLTSGSTLRQCTVLLKNCGAEKVFIAVAAVSMKHLQDSQQTAEQLDIQ